MNARKLVFWTTIFLYFKNSVQYGCRITVIMVWKLFLYPFSLIDAFTIFNYVFALIPVNLSHSRNYGYPMLFLHNRFWLSLSYFNVLKIVRSMSATVIFRILHYSFAKARLQIICVIRLFISSHPFRLNYSACSRQENDQKTVFFSVGAYRMKRWCANKRWKWSLDISQHFENGLVSS